MTNQYSQEQVDEIGVFMANKLNESNQALKDFLQEKIDNLVPVVPEPPETGEPVVPPATGGAGMFLDDGRQIKQALYEVVIPDTPNTNSVFKSIDPPLDMSKVISSTGILVLPDASEIINRQENQYGNGRYWEYGLRSHDMSVHGFENKTYLYGATVKILVTSLV